MQPVDQMNPKSLARWSGGALLATIVIGMVSAFTISHGIDINMSADVAATAENMLAAETRLHAKAYIGLLLFATNTLISVGLYLLLRKYGPLLAGWSLITGIGASILSLLGPVFAMNAAQIGGNAAYSALTDADGRLLLAGLQATSDYTSFHLSLVISSVSMAGFFGLLFRSRLIPTPISGFGVFASLFVATMIVARDFIPSLGSNAVTFAFMICNLAAMVLTGLYLTVKGVKDVY